MNDYYFIDGEMHTTFAGRMRRLRRANIPRKKRIKAIRRMRVRITATRARLEKYK